jgi:predicted regulator of Ras-like GTPase activity (Roadblock/LC7/MglB family)
MPQFPQLLPEDFEQIRGVLTELLVQSEARAALFVEKAGYLIAESGDVDGYNTTEIATLGANAFAATQFLADRVQETNCTTMFQQGDRTSVLWMNVEENSLLLIVFAATLSVGMVKFYASMATERIARQMTVAHQRDPATGLDLSDLNPDDVSVLFARRSA